LNRNAVYICVGTGSVASRRA